jgi:hypothetical protein
MPDNHVYAEAFARLDELCKAHGLGVPAVALFHRQSFPAESRVGLFAPPGSGGASLFESLTGVAVLESDARGRIPEATRGTSLVSFALCGAVGRAAESAEWLECVALPVIVTPAAAVLGKTEVGMMRMLSARGRDFAVVVLGMNGSEPDALREIEAFRLRPLTAELGRFLSIVDDGTRDVSKELWSWAESRLERAKRRQLALTAEQWLDGIEQQVAENVAEDERKATRIAHIDAHREALTHYLRDVPDREIGALVKELREERDALEDASVATAQRLAAWLVTPSGSWRREVAALDTAWKEFIERCRGAVRLFGDAVGSSINRQIDEFVRAYGVNKPMTITSAIETATDLSTGADPNAVERYASECTSRYVTGPIRRSAVGNKTLGDEVTQGFYAAVVEPARKLLAVALAHLEREAKPTADKAVREIVDEFDACARESLRAARAALVWNDVRNDVKRRREEWSILTAATESEAR